MAYRPALPFSTVLVVLKPTIEKVAGVRTKVLPDLDKGFKIHCSFKTYGGTERNIDGILAIEDTADIDTWYRPDITSDCIVVFPDTGIRYEIINEPENIEMRNQFMKFKVRRVKGGV